MSLSNLQIKKLLTLIKEYTELKFEKLQLLKVINEAEVVESVYNSNAIENSTLTLGETEKILIDLEIGRNTSIREVFEAKNLAKVTEYLNSKEHLPDLNIEMILFFHKILLSNIRDDWAGRIRAKNEFVRVGIYVAPNPEEVEGLLTKLLLDYKSDFNTHSIEKIAKFHLDFERIHPFCDGNGRIGRALINFQLLLLGLPPLIIRDADKRSYYSSFKEYNISQNPNQMITLIFLSLSESLHKRLAYLKSKNIIKLSDYIKTNDLSAPIITTQAKRQNIPAFRDGGVWKIGV